MVPEAYQTFCFGHVGCGPEVVKVSAAVFIKALPVRRRKDKINPVPYG